MSVQYHSQLHRNYIKFNLPINLPPPSELTPHQKNRSIRKYMHINLDISRMRRIWLTYLLRSAPTGTPADIAIAVTVSNVVLKLKKIVDTSPNNKTRKMLEMATIGEGGAR